MRALLQEFSQLLNLDFLELLHRGSNLTADQWKKNDIWGCTPQKINMEPENDGLEDDFPFPGVYSQVPC